MAKSWVSYSFLDSRCTFMTEYNQPSGHCRAHKHGFYSFAPIGPCGTKV